MTSISITRDPLGVHPLYYALAQGEFLYSKDISTILNHPNFHPKIDEESLNELFSMGPAHSMGRTCFSNIYEVRPGHTITFDGKEIHDMKVHQFGIKEHEDSYEDTILKVKELLTNSINRCKDMCRDKRVASLLSGGLDSSYITARIQDITKDTYSFEFEDASKHFTGSSYQPSLDAPYVQVMVEHLKSNHKVLTLSTEDLVEHLADSVDAHKLPAMADIDSSFIGFLKQVNDCDYVFTGECSDELFAGYPWYHRCELADLEDFPWSYDYDKRLVLLRDDIIRRLSPREYCKAEYERACKDVDIPPFETPKELVHRKQMYLTMRYFMTTLMDRTNCAAEYTKLSALVPFADTALAEYLFNVPYEMKTRNGQVKNLLVEAAKGILPDEIRLRKKSPFPKTYDKDYERRITHAFRKMMADSSNPILDYIDPKKVRLFLEQPKNLGAPWFGQLMCGPQLLSYYLQINTWLKKYV